MRILRERSQLVKVLQRSDDGLHTKLRFETSGYVWLAH